MKMGDSIAVQMEGFHVANAVVEEINSEEAVIYIPATRVVLGVDQRLVDKAPEAEAVVLTDSGLESTSTEPKTPGPAPINPASATQAAPETVVNSPSTSGSKELADAYNGAYVPLEQQVLNSDAIDRD